MSQASQPNPSTLASEPTSTASSNPSSAPSSPSPTTPGNEAQRDALLDSERQASERQPGSFKDEAITDKVVEIPPVPKDEAPIKGLDPKSR
jgi:hypothetical protein